MTEHATGTPQASPLRRSRSDRTLAGVCGGLAAYFEAASDGSDGTRTRNHSRGGQAGGHVASPACVHTVTVSDGTVTERVLDRQR
ncbi:MAG TPA: PspC domain-containing protein [Candidatus Limnocylindria bacterium]